MEEVLDDAITKWREKAKKKKGDIKKKKGKIKEFL